MNGASTGFAGCVLPGGVRASSPRVHHQVGPPIPQHAIEHGPHAGEGAVGLELQVGPAPGCRARRDGPRATP